MITVHTFVNSEFSLKCECFGVSVHFWYLFNQLLNMCSLSHTVSFCLSFFFTNSYIRIMNHTDKVLPDLLSYSCSKAKHNRSLRPDTAHVKTLSGLVSPSVWSNLITPHILLLNPVPLLLRPPPLTFTLNFQLFVRSNLSSLSHHTSAWLWRGDNRQSYDLISSSLHSSSPFFPL